MLKKILIDQLPNGNPITIPAEVHEKNFVQQIKRFIEIADDSYFDGQLHVSHFRTCHGGEWTLKILDAIVQELQHPSIELDIKQERHVLLPFFEYQLDRHRNLNDSQFSFRGRKPTLPK